MTEFARSLEVDPEVVEEWKWMGSPVRSHEGMYALANAHKDKVKLAFVHGTELPDPKKLFNVGRSRCGFCVLSGGYQADGGHLQAVQDPRTLQRRRDRSPRFASPEGGSGGREPAGEDFGRADRR